MREAIKEAIFAKAGRKAEAHDILNELVTEDPDNAAAWFVLAQVVEDRGQAIRCLRRVVYLDPTNERARAYLAKLEAKAAGRKPGKGGTSRRAVDDLVDIITSFKLPEPLQRFKWLIGLGAVLLLMGVMGLIAAQLLRPASPASITEGGSTGGDSAAMAVEPTPTPTSSSPQIEPTPLPTATPDAELIAMRDLVGATQVNPMDLIAIMERFELVDQPLQRALDGAPGYTTGSRDTFW
jgi:tetratricopeptide (TPR) repeat protein